MNISVPAVLGAIAILLAAASLVVHEGPLVTIAVILLGAAEIVRG